MTLRHYLPERRLPRTASTSPWASVCNSYQVDRNRRDAHDPPPLGVSKNALWVPMAWFPDGTKLLVGAFESGHTSGWTVSVLSGTARMLRDPSALGVGLLSALLW